MSEQARLYLHAFGPATAQGFGRWAGIGVAKAVRAFDQLGDELTAVQTPSGDTRILGQDEPTLREPPAPAAPALPVPDAGRRGELWTPRVWLGALLVGGQIVGTWRRANRSVTIQTWQRLSRPAREAVLAEAESLPLPDTAGRIVVYWD